MNGTCVSGTTLETTQFIYDGDGNLVKKINSDLSRTLYIGGVYEIDKSPGGSVVSTTTYYPVGGAMRIDGTLYFVLKDHLGSASVVTDSTGNVVGENRYYPFGETRLTTGTMYTDKLYTGQREVTGLGIYHYGARFYSPRLGRFLGPDTIIPDLSNPQYWNRYSYVLNNPIIYTDPTGHFIPQLLIAVGLVLVISQIPSDVPQSPPGVECGPPQCGDRDIVSTGVNLIIAGLVGDILEEENKSKEPKQLQDGNKFHYGEGGGPDQLQEMYPDTEFDFAGRGEPGPDVTYTGGKHPSEYPNSTWDPGNDYGDFKTNSPWSPGRFEKEIRDGKLPPNTQPLPYDPRTGKLLPKHKFKLILME